MLETIREYAWERLLASGAREAVQHAHAAYFLALVERSEPHLFSAHQPIWLDCLAVEFDNVRAVLAWLGEAEDRGQLRLRLTGALWPFWWVRGYLSEGRQWLAAALQDRLLPG
jgi:predicted ATPase